MFGLRTPELLAVLLVIVLLLGARRLPGLGAALGGALRGFRRAMAGGAEPGAGASAEPRSRA